MTRHEHFSCPECNSVYHSNYRLSLRRSAALALLFWLLAVLTGLVFFEAWQKVVALAIEMGVPISLLVGIVLHKLTLKVEQVEGAKVLQGGDKALTVE